MTVGPTKRKPRRRRSALSCFERGVKPGRACAYCARWFWMTSSADETPDVGVEGPNSLGRRRAAPLRWVTVRLDPSGRCQDDARVLDRVSRRANVECSSAPPGRVNSRRRPGGSRPRRFRTVKQPNSGPPVLPRVVRNLELAAVVVDGTPHSSSWYGSAARSPVAQEHRGRPSSSAACISCLPAGRCPRGRALGPLVAAQPQSW